MNFKFATFSQIVFEVIDIWYSLQVQIRSFLIKSCHFSYLHLDTHFMDDRFSELVFF